MHGRKQAEQTKEMVAVEVADENIKNAVMLDLVPHKLVLGTFAAIY
jgi:hypothetical protein